MILEVAILNIKAGQQERFENDFRLAGQYISAIEGYVNHTLKKCIETDYKYILLVNWETVAHHNIGFRTAPEYLKWKALLHHYYSPFPTVEHYETLI
ncbi:antibiotic biosynthesis monooxygenase [Formosa sediminum]|uniref:Antibiotic biosynthesis monooxygenase n=1 Tax=Formosa sediminum TaxID=2594004 RepID=A0A516GU91_9FLAO|nr:antibiotic biosynthesis monooxygenase [Formosa sediminum]QDO95091.1 antibiotic biosynthesis monooxygenase [Formosa sediminum]